MRKVCISFAAFSLLGAATVHPVQALEIGIDRSGLSNQSEAVQKKTLQDIHDLHAMWFRDAVSFSSDHSPVDLVKELRLVKQNNLKILANVLPSYRDFDRSFANADQSRELCGWQGGSGKLSEINLEKFSGHLRELLGAAKAANLTIDAFEIGNEFDTTCYDADVPVGHPASEAEIQIWLRGYGEFLKTAALVIRDPGYFPQAKIITFGIAHGSDQWDNPRRHLSNPASIVARLPNVNGFNYLDNSQYHVDAYGTHVYPWPGNPAKSLADTLQQDVRALGSDKPLWVTEWGSLSHSSFPTENGLTLERGTQEMLTTFERLSSSIHFGPLMFYSYNGWLANDAGQLQPLANVLSDYAARHPSP